jgi:group I intron endonuclease
MKRESKYPKGAGIYKLTCSKNGKVYIGKSVDVYYRLSCHKSVSEKSKGNYYFENALIKYGWDSFEVEILETFESFDKQNEDHRRLILERESHYIELFDSINKKIGYNICKFSTDMTGTSPSIETRLKISLGNMGKTHSDETKDKIRKARAGKPGTPHTEEHKERMRVLNLGKKMSNESKEKLRNLKLGIKLSEEIKKNMAKAQFGRKHSEETKIKMSLWQKGKPKSEEHVNKMKLRKHSEESKEKLRQSKLGKKLSEDHCKKISEGHRGRKHSEETKEKIRQGNLGKKRHPKQNLNTLLDVGLNNVAEKGIEVDV